jgi:hypothetical protein
MKEYCHNPRIDRELSIKLAREVREDNVELGAFEASMVIRKLWKPGQEITISFLDGLEDQKEFVRTYCVDWLKYIDLRFTFVEHGIIRISFKNKGSYSAIGTDALGFSNETMNFGWLEKGTVIHEFRHMLGLIHSHNSKNFPYHFNEANVIKDLSGPPNNWSLEMIHWNVLDRVTEEVTELPWEPQNVMNYAMPASWLLEGVAIVPGSEPGETEKELVRANYNGQKSYGPGMMITGILPDSIQVMIEQAGAYMLRMSPRGARGTIDGNSGIVFLNPGMHTVRVEGRGPYSLVVRRY